MFPAMETLIPDGSLFPIFFTIFCVIYIIGYFGVFRNWSPDHRPDAASCFISFFHGTPAAVFATVAVLTEPVRGFASPNTYFQNHILDFSIAYFTVDLLHLLILIPRDYLFIAHHIATLWVFITCRYLVHHGAYAILVLLILAEVTSFCQNVWTLAGVRKMDLPLAAKIYKSLSPPYYALYTLMRVFAGPLFFFKMSLFHMTGKARDVIPMWVSLSWIIVIGGAILVSILWISNHWMELYRERSGSSEKKER